MLLGTRNPVQPWKPLHLIHSASTSEMWPMVAMRRCSTHPSAVPIKQIFKFYCVFVFASSQHKAICGTGVKERLLRSESIPFR